MQTSAQKLDRVLGSLSTASIKDIKQSIKAINKELSSGAIERGSAEWNFLNEQLRRCKMELRDVGKESAVTESIWDRTVNFLNKNWGALTQIIGTITGLTVTIRKTIKDFADMEEAMADTRKYTGLTDEAVRDLNEDLKKMDTRTGREELNELAGAAGRLGKTSKKDILEFVEAGNMIKVALGDDLGEGAIDKVGKLAMAFGEDERMGLRGAMLATGSAVNELAQNSSAQAGYLVEFTARVAGFGKQLGLTQAQIMGFGAVMDENLLQDEMAATAFGNMLTKMQTDTAKFAKIAGMDVKQFADLLNKDANAAVLALADSLKKADPNTMMKMLDDMGLDGSRAVGVLSTLADKIDDVRQRQQLATKAYADSTSVIKEYDVQNNTVQAGIDKAKKRFQEVSIELGEKLMPIAKYAISNVSILVKSLNVLIEFLDRHKVLIIALATQIAILNAKRLYGIGLAKIEVLWNGKVASSIKAIGTAIKANPWGLAITAVTAFVTLLVEAASRSRQNVEEMTALGRAHKKAADEFDSERRRIEMLNSQVHNNKLSYEKRKEALDELKEIVPGYLAGLDREKGLLNDNTDALTDYLTQLEKSIKMKAAQEELEGEYRKKRNLERQRKALSQDLDDANMSLTAAQLSAVQQAGRLGTSGMRNLSIGMDVATKNAQDRVNNVREQLSNVHEQLQQTETDIKELNDEVVNTSAELHNLQRDNSNEGNKRKSKGDYITEEELKKAEAERKRREAEQKQRLKEAEDAAKAESDARIATLTHQYAMGEIAYRQYIQRLAELQTEGLKNRRDVYEKGSAEYEKLNRQVEERNFKGDQQVNRMKLEDLRRFMQVRQAEIEAQAVRGEISEAERLEDLRTLEESYLADVVALYKEGSLERMQAEWELQDAEQRNKLERERYYQQQLEQVRERYLGMGNERQMQVAMQGLDELHRAGLLKEEEYQEAKLAIEAQYAGYESSSERDRRVGSNALKVAQDKAKQKLDSEESSSVGLPFAGDIVLYQSTMEQLKQMYQDDKITHDQYLAAKQQATAQFCENMASQMQAAYNAVNQVMSAASSYFSAQQEYETAEVQKKYEKQIEAAGNNQAKVKKLQEKQQKEEAAIKTKYAKRAAAIQMAQAVAQTAISAINAYSSAAAIPVVGYILAPIAAAMAIAAGMLQITTIKKQQQKQEAGYYEGGFTGGRQYRREAGVVHEGEFVANHRAVQNPNILPFLNFLDQAQRNNTVGSLTMQDVSRSMGAGGSAQVVAPIVNVQTDNEELRSAIEQQREATNLLLNRLEEPIEAQVVLTGPNGLNAKQDLLNRMTKNR